MKACANLNITSRPNGTCRIRHVKFTNPSPDEKNKKQTQHDYKQSQTQSERKMLAYIIRAIEIYDSQDKHLPLAVLKNKHKLKLS